MKILVTRLMFLALVSVAVSAQAQLSTSATLPEWDKLPPQQREAMIAPVRERWNNEPEQRQRMLHHAQRWQSMTPEQRSQARKGMRRFEGMDPQQRQQARALFESMQGLPPDQRRRLRDEWKQMTPDQRRDWAKKHAPKEPTTSPSR